MNFGEVCDVGRGTVELEVKGEYGWLQRVFVVLCKAAGAGCDRRNSRWYRVIIAETVLLMANVACSRGKALVDLEGS